MDTQRDYRRLDSSKKEIRIIKIHAAPIEATAQDADKTITCSLETIPLREANPFHALSYVWGEAEPTAPILLNGRVVPVRKNLWNFLLALRSRFCQGPTDTIRIWADYICIQQADLEERSAQILIMGEIYQAADSVYAWLGNRTDVGDNDREQIRMRNEHLQRNQALSHMARNNRSAYQNMALSAYWTRLWIKQEVILSKDVWFFYGQGVTHWKELRLATMLKQERVRQPHRMTSTNDTGQPISAFMTALLNLRALRSGHDNLPELVHRFKDAQCQDEKDRVYALLALTDPSTREKIVVDYSKPLIQVLLESYPYWSSDLVSWLAIEYGASKIPVYQHQSFVAQMSQILSPNKLYSISQEEDLASRATAQAIFTTSGLSEVTSVQHITSIGSNTLTPASKSQQSALKEPALVLKVFTKTPLPGRPHKQRGCFVYANAEPARGDMLGKIGNQLFFLRNQNSNDGTISARKLIIQATGIEALPVTSSNPSSGHLSTQLYQHPCRWYQFRTASALFQIVDPSSHEDRQRKPLRSARNGVAILYNAPALVTLLIDSNVFQIDELQEHDGGQDNLPHVWSPYAFGQHYHILDSCHSCRTVGRTLAEERWGIHASEIREECDCRWIAP
ncbi:hypothetical protein CBER1_05972 [Cercospora berteroae]|uniref:Heterokaryon incompatibility domain-containing protein n=1 Tax=Cercospora berteroae TaxID=357750 RepID=A0A2S6CAP9_9PEZI|nr:hypothetical protein CBER1_05972 [Cercospora berteroae]